MNIDYPEDYFDWLPGYKARVMLRTRHSRPATVSPEAAPGPYKPPVRFRPTRKIGFRKKAGDR